MTLGTKTRRPEFDLAAASAYNGEVHEQQLDASTSLRMRTHLEDMTVVNRNIAQLV